MFRRRTPISPWQRFQRWLWPHIGWRRWGTYFYKRLTRLPGTPHSIAAGFACGVAVSFTPFVGLHLIGSTLLSFVVRGNYIAAWVGTLIGNPWTFPFIWLITYRLGLFLLGVDDGAAAQAEVELQRFERLVDDLGRYIWPMTLGGVPAGIVVGLVTYFPLTRAIETIQVSRRRRRERGRMQRARRSDLQATGSSAGARAP